MIGVARASNPLLRRAVEPESCRMSTPILLIPGLNCTAEVYAAAVPALWQFGSVLIPDHKRGSSIAEIAAAILAEAPPSFALAGFSMGGYIAFELLRQAPGRITRLALIDTMARLDAPDRLQKRHDAIRLAQAGKHRQLVAANFPDSVHPDNANSPAIRDFSLRMAVANGPEVYVRQQQAIIGRSDSTADLAGIRVPTTIIVGEADTITPVAEARAMTAAIPDANLVVIERAGHMSPTEQPEAVAQALVGWLQR
jgi:pimeloyl-ACP methyl ester carboxylesterase